MIKSKFKLNEEGKKYLNNFFYSGVTEEAIKCINYNLAVEKYKFIYSKYGTLVKFTYRSNDMELFIPMKYLDRIKELKFEDINPYTWYTIEEIDLQDLDEVQDNLLVLVEDGTNDIITLYETKYLRSYNHSMKLYSLKHIVKHKENFINKQIMFLAK